MVDCGIHSAERPYPEVFEGSTDKSEEKDDVDAWTPGLHVYMLHSLEYS
jgi:hypothetical protein